MLESLRNNLRSAIKKVVGASDVNEELVDGLCKDVQRALLQSDVGVRLVVEISKKIKERALHESPPKGLSRKDHIVSIVFSELANLLGYAKDSPDDLFSKTDVEKSTGIPVVTGKINVFLMVGIQGSGKTTVTAKLSKWLIKHGYRVAVIGADTWRPGALTQLKMNCTKMNVEVYGDESIKDPIDIVSNGLKYFSESGLDVIIIDTAGRHKDELGLIKEMSAMHKISKPDLVLLVIDGTIGQQAYSQARSFHDNAPVGGIIITKLDGTAKGGGALAATAATGAKILFIGNGERIDDLEQFSPTRFVGRLLGMGDLKALLEMAKDLEACADENQSRRVLSGRMSIEDFYAQMESVGKMGFRNILESLPGLSGLVKEDQLDILQKKMSKWRYIIQSMTKEEKNSPDIINDARRKRIARGAGVMEHEVKDLIKNFNNSKSMMKQAKGRQMHGMLRKLGIG